MIVTDINQKAKEIYSENKAKGWWDDKKDLGERVVLIQSEMFEALEADRKQKFTEYGNCEYLYSQLMTYKKFDPKSFKEAIKDTFEDEIADVAIRLLDLCGGLQIPLTPKDIPHFDLNKGYIVFTVFTKATSKMYEEMTSRNAQWILGYCYSVAALYNFDLNKHIELKLAYNKTRPYKHGKKY